VSTLHDRLNRNPPLTLTSCARRLGVAYRVIRDAVTSGEITPTADGFVDPKSAEAWASVHAKEAPVLTPADLVGMGIHHAHLEDGCLRLIVEAPDRVLHLLVMCDQEGNGPGALHVFDPDAGAFVGILGGRP